MQDTLYSHGRQDKILVELECFYAFSFFSFPPPTLLWPSCDSTDISSPLRPCFSITSDIKHWNTYLLP